MHTPTTTSTLLLLASLLAFTPNTILAQEGTSTVNPISQIPDGQPQAPTSIYSNPFVTQTDSRGVVTGQPIPETSQPLPETSQPLPITTQPSVVTDISPAATYYSTGPPGVPMNTTLVSVLSSGTGSAAGNLSSSTRTLSSTRTGATPTGAEEEATSTDASASEATGAAASIQIAGTGIALGLAGSVFALFL